MEPQQYYSQSSIAEKIVEFCRDREVVGRTPDGAYGTRPNVLQYPGDLARMAENFYSFHGSLERWSNPMMLSTGKDLEKFRTGWDLVIDLDGNNFEIIRSCAQIIIEALQAHGISSISLKFSGNKGFHIGVPFESFPKVVDKFKTKRLFPELPRQIALYLRDFIEAEFSNELSSKMTYDEYAEIIGKSVDEVTKNGQIDPWAAMTIDTIVVSPRHLVRVPYSLHEKSGLASVPIKFSQLKKFKKEDAKPEKIKAELDFLSRKNIVTEATELVSLAMTHRKKEERPKIERPIDRPIQKLPEEYFPPCIKNILKGVKDGRKRSEFILRCFLWRCGWDWEDIRKLMLEWNQRNPTPLKENYLLGQLKWHMKQKKGIMPPNCSNELYYKDFMVCEPDTFCENAKSPVVSALRRLKPKGQQTKKRKGV